jgi:DNA-directed RNA polymerase specialized sigma subunit
MSRCDNCEMYGECSEPCEAVLALLDSADRGRLARNINSANSVEVEKLLKNSAALDPATDAILHLYYRSSFTMERIARSLGMNRSSVSRRIAGAWKNFPEKLQQERHV